MNQEILFGKKLEEVRRLAASQGAEIALTQIDSCFAELKLSDEQSKMVQDYLLTKGVHMVVDESMLGEVKASLQDISKDPTGAGDENSSENPEETEGSEEELSRPEFDYLKQYMEELEELPDYTDGQKIAYAMSAMAGDKTAQNKLVEAYLKEVPQIARIYTGQGVDIGDLIGEGNVALATGVTLLGSQEKPEECEGLLIKLVMDAMEEIIKETRDSDEVYSKAVDLCNRIAAKAEDYYSMMGKKASIQELAKMEHVSAKSIRDAMRISGFQIDLIEPEQTSEEE